MEMEVKASASINKTTVYLPIGSCYFLDFPDNRESCDDGEAGQPQFCYYCRFLGRFLTSEALDDYDQPGHVICLFILGINLVLGTFGALANVLIIAVLKQRRSKKAFDTFLLTLACYDIICSVFPIIWAVGSVMYFQNWNRGRLPLYLYYFGTYTTMFGRAGSSFMTVLISFERYLAVAYPIRTLGWFTLRRTRILSLCSLLFALVMALPRYVSVFVGENRLGRKVPATQDLEYLLLSTSLEKVFFVTLKGYFNQIDFWAPLPLLLLFNGLIYFHIFRYTSQKTVLDTNQKNEVQAVKMFLPVVVALFICNIVPISLNYYLVKWIYYRELAMGVGLSYVINSAVNLPIYYFGGSNFRKETKALLRSSFPCVSKCFETYKVDEKIILTNGSKGTEGY